MLLAVLVSGINAAWGDSYKLVKSVSELSKDDIILITSGKVGAVKALGPQTGNNCPAKDITISSETITDKGDAQEIVFDKTDAYGNFTFNVGTNLYLYAASSSKNYLKTQTSGAYWKIQINGSSYAATITDQSHTSNRNLLRYNSNDKLFSCYSSGQADVYIFKKVVAPAYALTITDPVGGTITVLDDEANEVSSGDKFEEDTELTISAEASTGYTFSTWTKSAGTFGSAATEADNTFTMPAEAATIGATFTKNTYDLTLKNTYGSCAVTVDGEEWDGSSKIPYNAEVEITATPNDGYLFAEWTSTNIGEYDEVSNPLTFNMPAGDVEIEASFVDASSYYSITVDGDVTGGTIVADKASAAEAATINLTATPSAGYTFTSWNVKDEGDNTITVTDNHFTMPASNVTVTATFTAIAVTGITLNKSKASIGVGSTETLTATVAPANALNKAVTWTSNNTSVATVVDGVVTAVAVGSATITATTEDRGFTATCAVTVENVVTFDATSDTGTSPLSKNGVSFACSNGVLNNSSEYRLYKNSETTISTSTGKITKIEFTGVSGNPASGFASQSGWTTDGDDGIWTGSAASVTFTASGAQVRATKIKVYVATTAAPTFSVAAGEYSEAKSVELSCATDGATIYYTTNGDTPTSSSTAYSSAIAVTETMTLKAIAIKSGVESAVTTATYTMIRPEAPTFDVATRVFDAAFDLHLNAADGTTIYYTTDGTDPTSGSSVYSSKVAISAATTTVKAIAVKDGLTSDVASETYTYDARITPTFTLSTTSLDLKVKDISSAVSLTTNSDATPSFTCADAHVTLTGTGNSRTISASAAGEYTVNVSVTGSATYKDAAGSITVTVTKKATTMTITPSFTSTDLYVTKSGSVSGSVKYNDAAVGGASVSYSSSDETVATINSSTGAITFKKAGSTSITASYEGNDEYDECEATYVLNLVDTTPQDVEVNITLNNTFFGCDAFTSYSKGDPTSYSKTVNNVTVTYDKGTGSGFYCNASGLRLYSGGHLTFSAPAGYVITKIAMTGDDNFSDGLTNPEASATWTGNATSVDITGETKSGSTRKNMTGATVTLAETVTVGSTGYTTYVTKHDVSFDGVTAYIAKTVNAESITLEKIDEAPLGTPVIIKASVGIHALEAIDTDPTVSGNLLLASDGSVTGNGTSIYALGVGKSGVNKDVVGFYLVNNGQTIPAGKAYLNTAGGGAVKEFLTFDFDDATAVSEVKNEGVNTEKSIFNLAGQKMSKLQKGVNIVNGKKVLVK